jgi:hypothetical protein
LQNFHNSGIGGQKIGNSAIPPYPKTLGGCRLQFYSYGTGFQYPPYNGEGLDNNVGTEMSSSAARTYNLPAYFAYCPLCYAGVGIPHLTSVLRVPAQYTLYRLI